MEEKDCAICAHWSIGVVLFGGTNEFVLVKFTVLKTKQMFGSSSCIILQHTSEWPTCRCICWSFQPKPVLLTSPYIIGLTGGIASGKSSVCERLRKLGARIVDCDKLGKINFSSGPFIFVQVKVLLKPLGHLHLTYIFVCVKSYKIVQGDRV